MIQRSVIAAIPCYDCAHFICRAVESLLHQSYSDITVVVINDGDRNNPPWPALAHIRDPRLVRFDLQENHGPYFALQVALYATQSEYFLVQDADDWSDEERVTTLLQCMVENHADVAISDQSQYLQQDGAAMVSRKPYEVNPAQLYPGSQLKLRFRHHGLYRVSSLKAIGGYYGGCRMSYDMYVTNLLLLTGKVAVSHKLLYHYYRRANSLTTSPDTGMSSPARVAVECRLRAQFADVWRLFDAHEAGMITANCFAAALRKANGAFVPDTDAKLILNYAAALQNKL